MQCVSFNSKAQGDTKLDIVLPLQDVISDLEEIETEYISLPCTHTSAFRPFNMEVVHMSGGAICICVQHAPRKRCGCVAVARSHSGFPSSHPTVFSFPATQQRADGIPGENVVASCPGRPGFARLGCCSGRLAIML